MSERPATAAAAIVRAQSTVRAVERDGDNTHHRYLYVSADERISVTRWALSEAGAALITIAQRVELVSPLPEQEGYAGRLHSDYRVIHESGDAIDLLDRSIPILLSRGRPLDKAELAASTSLLGYVCRDLLMLAVREPEISDRDDTGEEPRGRQSPVDRDYPQEPQRAAPHAQRETPAAITARVYAPLRGQLAAARDTGAALVVVAGALDARELTDAQRAELVVSAFRGAVRLARHPDDLRLLTEARDLHRGRLGAALVEIDDGIAVLRGRLAALREGAPDLSAVVAAVQALHGASTVEAIAACAAQARPGLRGQDADAYELAVGEAACRVIRDAHARGERPAWGALLRPLATSPAATAAIREQIAVCAAQRAA